MSAKSHLGPPKSWPVLKYNKDAIIMVVDPLVVLVYRVIYDIYVNFSLYFLKMCIN